jgi:hypothetical protein
VNGAFSVDIDTKKCQKEKFLLEKGRITVNNFSAINIFPGLITIFLWRCHFGKIQWEGEEAFFILLLLSFSAYALLPIFWLHLHIYIYLFPIFFCISLLLLLPIAS